MQYIDFDHFCQVRLSVSNHIINLDVQIVDIADHSIPNYFMGIVSAYCNELAPG